jgi:hypothetical protein
MIAAEPEISQCGLTLKPQILDDVLSVLTGIEGKYLKLKANLRPYISTPFRPLPLERWTLPDPVQPWQ